MRKSDRLKTVKEAVKELESVIETFAIAVDKAMDQRGLGRSSWVNGDITHGGTTVSPVEAAMGKPDKAATDLRRLDRRLHLLKNAVDDVRRFSLEYGAPVGIVDPEGEQGCTSCARLRVQHGKRFVARWEPVHKAGLCRWCYDFRSTEKAIPPLKLLQAHHDGKRVTAQMVKAARRGMHHRREKTRR